jgi:hypothetical protein
METSPLHCCMEHCCFHCYQEAFVFIVALMREYNNDAPFNCCVTGEPWYVTIWSSSLCDFLHSPVTSSLLGPNIHLRTLFSNTLSLCSSHNVTDSFTLVQNNWQNYDFVCFNCYIRREKAGKTKESGLISSKHSPNFSLLLISSCINFSSVSVVTKYLNSGMSSKELFDTNMLYFCPAFW